MKILAAILLFLLPGSAWCDYEPRLTSFDVEGNKVTFTLDNGWVFTSEAPLESKLYALDRLIDMRVRMDTYPSCPLLELTIENPEHRGKDRISFQGTITKETYESLLTVTQVEYDAGYLYSDAYVTLSDGSRWYVERNLGVWFVNTYWATGDRIMVTRYFPSSYCTLVNLDVSGYAFVDYYVSNYEHFYSMRDPRSILVTRSK